MKITQSILIVLTVLLFALSCNVASASQVVKMEMGEIVNEADIIISGKVVNIENEILEKHGNKVPHTFITLEVEEILKGDVPGGTYTFNLSGGVLPEENLVYAISGMPEFQEGQEVFLFLKADRNLYSPVVGFYQGRFNLTIDKESGAKYVYDNFGKPVTEALLKGTDETPEKAGIPVTYEVFKNIVKSGIEDK